MNIQVNPPEMPAALALVWGADNIAKAINRPIRATYHLLETNALPGASKVGGRWCFAPAVFYQSVAA